jgi:hypothetical protein
MINLGHPMSINEALLSKHNHMGIREQITVSAKQRYAKLKQKWIKFHFLICQRIQTNYLDKCIDNEDPNWVVLNVNNAHATIKS